jgi:hypothetical protein
MDMLIGLICFVTITVSFLYGTRIAWGCGKFCIFKEEPEVKKKTLREKLPVATGLYLFGFLIVFSYLLDGFVTIYICSLTSAILLSHLVVSMSIPELKRKPKPVHLSVTKETSSYRI